MTTKRVNLVAGTIVGGALLLATAGFVVAQDPSSTPTPYSMPGMPGGMMGGQDIMGGSGMMGGQNMDAAQIAAMHEAMGQDGACDPELMQSMHEQYHPTR